MRDAGLLCTVGYALMIHVGVSLMMLPIIGLNTNAMHMQPWESRHMVGMECTVQIQTIFFNCFCSGPSTNDFMARLWMDQGLVIVTD